MVNLTNEECRPQITQITQISINVRGILDVKGMVESSSKSLQIRETCIKTDYSKTEWLHN